MKTGLNDLDKTILTVWGFLGGCAGIAFLAVLHDWNAYLSGGLGILAGLAIGGLFIRGPRPRKGRQGGRRPDLMMDSHITDTILNKVLEVYHVKVDPADEQEVPETGGDPVENPDTLWENESGAGFWRSLSLTSKILMVFGGAWPFLFGLATSLFPDLTRSNLGEMMFKALLLLPISLSAILNGWVLLFHNRTRDDLEPDPGDIWTWWVGIFFVLLGLGMTAYFIVTEFRY